VGAALSSGEGTTDDVAAALLDVGDEEVEVEGVRDEDGAVAVALSADIPVHAASMSADGHRRVTTRSRRVRMRINVPSNLATICRDPGIMISLCDSRPVIMAEQSLTFVGEFGCAAH